MALNTALPPFTSLIQMVQNSMAKFSETSRLELGSFFENFVFCCCPMDSEQTQQFQKLFLNPDFDWLKSIPKPDLNTPPTQTIHTCVHCPYYQNQYYSYPQNYYQPSYDPNQNYNQYPQNYQQQSQDIAYQLPTQTVKKRFFQDRLSSWHLIVPNPNQNNDPTQARNTFFMYNRNELKLFLIWCVRIDQWRFFNFSSLFLCVIKSLSCLYLSSFRFLISSSLALIALQVRYQQIDVYHSLHPSIPVLWFFYSWFCLALVFLVASLSVVLASFALPFLFHLPIFVVQQVWSICLFVLSLQFPFLLSQGSTSLDLTFYCIPLVIAAGVAFHISLLHLVAFVLSQLPISNKSIPRFSFTNLLKLFLFSFLSFCFIGL